MHIQLSRLIKARRHYVLAPLLGALGVLTFAPLDWWWLSLLVWLGFFVLLNHAQSTRAALIQGFLFGAGFFLTGVSWVYVSLSVYGNMPVPLAVLATLLFCLLCAFFPALAAGIYAWGAGRPVLRASWKQALLFAALYTLADWGRSWVFTGFPWLALGYAHSSPSPLAGFAPLFGVFGLSLLGTLCSVLLVCGWRGVVVSAGFMLAGLGLQQYGWTEPAGHPVTVSLVQGNIPQKLKFDPEHFSSTLRVYHDLIKAHPSRLTVLPETALAARLSALPVDYLDTLKQLARRTQGDLLFGVITGKNGRYYNSAVSLGHHDQQIYSKRHLVPFGEFVPFGLQWVLQWLSIPMSDLSPGDEVQRPLTLAGLDAAVNICYEDAFGSELIDAARSANLLINLSNTAWFGRSLAQWQHLQIAQMRALESGRPVLRATNTGMTAVITPDGRVAASLPAFTQGTLQTSVTGYQGSTPYLRWGNLPAVVTAFVLAILIPWWNKRTPNILEKGQEVIRSLTPRYTQARGQTTRPHRR